MRAMDGDIRLVDLTLGELFALLDERDAERENRAKQRDGLPTVVYGLAGVQQVYRCSKATAAKILSSGRIDAAVTRVTPRKIIVNVDKALALCPMV